MTFQDPKWTLKGFLSNHSSGRGQSHYQVVNGADRRCLCCVPDSHPWGKHRTTRWRHRRHPPASCPVEDCLTPSLGFHSALPEHIQELQGLFSPRFRMNGCWGLERQHSRKGLAQSQEKTLIVARSDLPTEKKKKSFKGKS